ncbi:SRPBCC domain-containing protein [Inhella proteolytica]|uniref:SRPBCC domain-containing protein n=1 Tax=Inhella proteolytica TaxID=2795029 RepID=A0A931NIS9_9BURK|nr:SRPBCC domain-containing protein [Inhella proteolytica]MBH9579183.1 SRPBCC domain-containing protein [Inhella proteolytica]
MSALPPVEKRIEVALDVEAAFDLFTRQMRRWWPLATHACGEGGGEDVRFEEHVGGRVLETGKDGKEHVWGTLTAWAPPHHFAMTWHPTRPVEQATQVSVCFEALPDGGCALLLWHGGWEAAGEQAAAMHEGYEGGWVGVLALFQQAAQAA